MWFYLKLFNLNSKMFNLFLILLFILNLQNSFEFQQFKEELKIN